MAAVALIANWMWPTDSTGLVGPSSNVAQPTARREQGKVDPAELQVRLDELSTARPEVGASQRNPFRIQPKAPPAPPPQAALPAVANPGPPPPVTGPPPPPPIPLKFIGIVEKPGGLKVAAMSDCRSTYYGGEGQIIDGRYRLIKIGVESMVIEYVDGRGRTTVRLEGCPAR